MIVADREITPEERAKMRNCAPLLGEPAATELVRVLDALEQSEARTEQAEAVVAFLVGDMDEKCPWDRYDPPSRKDWPDWCKISTFEGEFVGCSGEDQHEKCWTLYVAQKKQCGEWKG